MRRFKIGIFFLLFVMLTGCAGYTAKLKDTELSRSEVGLIDAYHENSADISDADDAVGESVETEYADKPAEADEADTVYLKPCSNYQDILDNVYEVIAADYTTNVVESDDAFTYVGVAETRIGRDVDETLASVGYTLFDVDGDEVDELIIVDTSEDESYNNRILIMASLLDDKPVEVVGGWATSRFYLLNDNTIYYEGSVKGNGVGFTIRQADTKMRANG